MSNMLRLMSNNERHGQIILMEVALRLEEAMDQLDHLRSLDPSIQELSQPMY